MKVQGAELIPKTGGVIIASTHIHILDPVAIAFCTKRHLRFMAKEELFRFKPFGALLRSLGAFPVRRGHSDKGAVETAAAVLKEGHILLMFPEGTRVKTGKPGSYKPGVILLSQMANVPIMPTAVIAKHIYKPFCRVTIRFGEPVTHQELGAAQADSKTLRAASDRLRERTVALMLEAGAS